MGITSFFDQTCIGLHEMDQKWANIGFQSQISKSNIDFIHLKIILHLEIESVEHFM